MKDFNDLQRLYRTDDQISDEEVIARWEERVRLDPNSIDFASSPSVRRLLGIIDSLRDEVEAKTQVLKEIDAAISEVKGKDINGWFLLGLQAKVEKVL